MKNQYTKYVKYLDKQANIYAQRAGESVYLTDGKIALKVPVAWYNTMVRPQSGLLPFLTEDCTADRHSSNAVVSVRANGFDIRQALGSLSADRIVRQSPVLLEIPRVGKGKKPMLVRIFKADSGEIVGVNNDYVDIFADCAAGEFWRSDGCPTSPLVLTTEDIALVMYPVRIAPAYIGCLTDLTR